MNIFFLVSLLKCGNYSFMSYSIYHFIHIGAVFVLFMSLGSMATVRILNPQKPWPKWLGMAHGLSLLIILIGGFGMLARLGLTDGFPTWIYFKLTIWLLLGLMIALIKKVPNKAQLWWIVTAALGITISYIVSYNT